MRIALVHDDLIQWGGAERVLLGISELFPEAEIFTLVFDASNPLLAGQFKGKKIITSPLQKLPFWRKIFKATMPLHPILFELFDFSSYDLVISQTTRFAKGIITKPECTHICYCHTPPRFLWNFSNEKVSKIISPLISFLRIWDQAASERPDYWLAGSKNAQLRIAKIYKKDSEVLLPFIDTDLFREVTVERGDYFVLIARLNQYKRVDVAVKVFSQNKLPLKIVGVGPQLRNLRSIAASNVEFLGRLSDEKLFNILSGCRGLILTAEEDFGLTPLEAHALGKPVIAYGKGGSRETIIEGKTGIFFNEQSEQALARAVEQFLKMDFNTEFIKNHAQNFSKKHFQQRLKNFIQKCQNAGG